MRLDTYLSQKYPEHSRSYLAKLIKSGKVKVSGKTLAKASFEINDKSLIEVCFPTDIPPLITPPLWEVLAETADYLAINKPAGIVVHPSAGHQSDSIASLLGLENRNLSQIDPSRPGIVHRLDKDTSGVLIIAKTDQFHRHLAQQIANHQVQKIYLSVVCGQIVEQGIIDAAIGRHPTKKQKMGIVKNAKSARTEFRRLEYQADLDLSLVEINLISGRTHQIRVHFQAIGHPVLGDPTYGDSKINQKLADPYEIRHQLLHAFQYSFRNLDNQLIRIQAPLSHPWLDRQNSIWTCGSCLNNQNNYKRSKK
ncbi:MAG TPA: RluA family pseudouridine synthase [Candidatus Gracilibacteria bacterium]|nr:RluA family pseudouridine synthase [Candidatus Gracilibacteria bacterium]